MFARLRQFLLYNNAFPLLIGGLFLTSGAALAADEGVRTAVQDAVVASERKVVSIDNSYLLGVNFNRYTPELQITEVREDAESYYVAYTLETIDLVEYVWQPVEREMVLVIAKDDLGGRDLGLRVTRELAQVVAGQIALLRETQEIERRSGESKKVVATVYQGLVGRYFDPTLEEFPGYEPVIPDTPLPNAEVDPGADDPDTPNEPQALSLQILGPNPLTLRVGEPYVELGVVVLDDGSIAEDAAVVIAGVVDTTQPGRYTIEYRASLGERSVSGERVVRVQSGSDSAGQSDTVPPVITLTGSPEASIMVGDAYADAGATAYDEVDGDLSAAVVASGSVDVTTAGNYTITYTVADAAGNTSEAVRTIIVTASPEVVPDPDVPEPEDVPEEAVTPPADEETSAPADTSPAEVAPAELPAPTQ